MLGLRGLIGVQLETLHLERARVWTELPVRVIALKKHWTLSNGFDEVCRGGELVMAGRHLVGVLGGGSCCIAQVQVSECTLVRCGVGRISFGLWRSEQDFRFYLLTT